MALYRNKYAHAAGGSAEHKKHNKQHQHHEHKPAVEKQKPLPAAKPPSPNVTKPTSHNATKFPAPNATKPTSQEIAGVAEKPVKKGFFAKLKGLFKK